MNAFITIFLDGYLWTSTEVCVDCAYLATRSPVILIKQNQSNRMDSTESFSDVLALLAMAANISLVMGLRCLAISSLRSRAIMIFEHVFSLSDRLPGTGKF